MHYGQHFSTKNTPVTEPIPGKTMLENSTGGFVFEAGKWKQLRRFLILGSEGGSYYASEKKLTKENCTNVIACLNEDYERAVKEILDVSVSGAAPKQDPTIFALALACTFGSKDKSSAYNAIPVICRTGTHLFTFCQAIKDLRGWSRGLRTAVSKYYLQDAGKVSYQLVKYRQRNGWTHRDVLRLCHAKGKTETHQSILRWAVGKHVDVTLPSIITSYETLKSVPKVDDKTIGLITSLPWEALPTEYLKDRKVWEALLPNMNITALMRNLNKLSLYAGVDSNLSEHSKFIADQFNEENIKKSKLHPLNILESLKTYGSGHGFKGNMTWKPVPRIMDALNEAFYLSFKNVESTGKSFCIGLDVSGSMSTPIMGKSLSCAEAAAALCMLIARTEPNFALVAFADRPCMLNIRPSMSLEEVMKLTRHHNFGATNLSLPMQLAAFSRWKVDCFQMITDNEVNSGFHPIQALNTYRQQSGINANLAVWGMTATNFTIADPNDPGTLDIVGYDSSVPTILRDFVNNS